MKSALIGIIVLIGIGIAGYFLFRDRPESFSVSPMPTVTPEATESPKESAKPSFTPMTSDITKLEAKILVDGSGVEAKAGDKLSVLYVGRIPDGQVFDASERHGNNPFIFTLGQGSVIKGWDIGVVGMKVGETRRLFIPSELGYGASGIPGSIIAPNTDLIFDVQLVNILP